MDIDKLIELFFSFQNPGIYALFTILFLIIVVSLIKIKYFIPLQYKKQQLELENTKLMALFAETDPNPIVRIDYSGKIISANKSAIKEFNTLVGKENNIKILHPSFNNSYNKQNAKYFEICLSNEHYLINIKEIEELKFIHIYFTKISKRIQYEKDLKASKESLKKLRLKLDSRNEAEKKRIGKELHDVVGSNIVLLKNDITNFLSSSDQNQFLKKVSTQIDNIQDDIRNISYQLIPRVLHEFGLIQALNSLIDSINNSKKIKGSFFFNDDNPTNSNNELDLNIYRVCQECISNIIQHSGCKEFVIQFVKQNDNLRIVISDDGHGFDVEQYMSKGSSSLGLLNIKERVESFNNGSLKINSNSEGTTIFINFHKELQIDKSTSC